jgi:hypothetical protein
MGFKNWLSKNYIAVCLITVFLFLLYGNYATSVFSQDSYVAYVTPNSANAAWALSLGRFIHSIFSVLMNEAKHQLLSYILSILFLEASFLLIYTLLIKNIENRLCKAGLFIGLLFLFANPFYCDWFQYTVKATMTFGVLLASLASYVFYKIDYSEKFAKIGIRYVFVFILLFLASASYQVTLEYFIVECGLLFGKTFFINAQRHDFYIFVRRVLAITAVFIFEGLFMYLFIKYFLPLFGIHSSRLMQVNIFDNMKIIANSLKHLIATNQDMMPKFVYLIFSGTLFLVFAIAAATKRRGLGIVVMIIGVMMVFIAPLSAWLLTPVWMAPRTLTVFMGIPGMLLIFIVFLDKKNSKQRNAHIPLSITKDPLCFISLILSITLLIVYVNQTIVISGDLLKVNALDQYIARMYYEQIEKYESENNITVTSLAFPDQSGTFFHYEDVIQTFDTNISSFGPDWSRVALMEYVTGRQFNEKIMNLLTYERYFGDRHWEYASPDQVVCDGNTAYIAVCFPR